jgi:hypothetical protein
MKRGYYRNFLLITLALTVFGNGAAIATEESVKNTDSRVEVNSSKSASSQAVSSEAPTRKPTIDLPILEKNLALQKKNTLEGQVHKSIQTQAETENSESSVLQKKEQEERDNQSPEVTTELAVSKTIPVDKPLLESGISQIKRIMVPADTLIYVTLSEKLHSNQNKQGDSVKATIAEPVYVGPFLTIPEKSIVTGKITDMCKKKVDKGPNPYIVVDFTSLQRPSESEAVPFNATLIAYKTGLNKKDYLWRMPTKGHKKKARLKSMLNGALTGLMINPIFGAPIGAGVNLLTTMAEDKVAARSAVKIKTGEQVPIAVQRGFYASVIRPNTEKAAL